MFEKKLRITCAVLCGLWTLAGLPAADAADNPALGIGEPNTPFTPPQGPRGCGDIPCDGCDDTGSPVFLSLGHAYLDFPDLTFGQDHPSFRISRRYNSGEFYVGFFGHGFHSSLDMMSISTFKGNVPDEVVIVRWPNGQRSTFTLQPDDSYSGPAERFDRLVKTPTGFELETPEGVIHTFDDETKLLSMVDRNGNAITLGYDGMGRPTTITLPGSRVITVTYNAGGFVDTISDFAGRSVSYGYDTAGFMTTFNDARGEPWSYQYQDDRLTEIINPLGQTDVALEYDAQGRMTHMVNEEGSFTYTYVNATTVRKTDDSTGGETTYLYDANGAVTRVTNAAGGVTNRTYDSSQNLTGLTQFGCTSTFTYDNQGRFLTRTEPGLGTTTFTYNPQGLVETVIDPLGTVTRYEYDVDGNLTRGIEDEGGTLQRETLFAYDVAGNLTSLTNPAGGQETYEYDSANRLTRVTNAVNESYTMAYDSLGNLTAVTNALSNTTRFEHDPLGVMTRLIDPLGNSYDMTLDGLGRIETIFDRTGYPTSYTYNAFDQETSITNALGQTMFNAYDSTGRVTLRTDANANTTGFEYNAAGHLTREVNALGNATLYGVNPRGNRTSYTDPNNRTVNYQYDCQNKLTRTDYPDGTFELYTVGPGGFVTARQDRDGLVSTFEYDALSRRTLATYPDGTTVEYGYDADDRLTSVENNVARIEFNYNPAGWMLSETNVTLGTTVQYGYDAMGRRTSLTDPQAVTTTYAYDVADNLTQIAHPTMGTLDLGYDAEGRRTSIAHSNGTTSTYAYDMAGRLTRVEHRRADTSLIASIENTFDAAGNILTTTDAAGIHTYGYDALYQLTSVTHPNPGVNPNESYAYDPAGNRTSSHLSASYVYDANNRLTEDDDFTYAYDARGNLTSRTDKVSTDVTAYAYSSINQLTHVVYPDATSNSFAYDGMERRVSTTTAAGTTSYYVYDELQVIGEYDPSLTLLAWYVTGLTEDDALLFSDGVGTFRYHKDGSRSTLAMTNAAGVVVQDYTYDSFGRVVAQTGSSRGTYTYTGREWDVESGLFNYRARNYDAALGRFLQVDPLGYAVGPNNYVYVGNSPVNFTDPLGLLGTPTYGNCCGPQVQCEPGGDNCEEGPRDETDQCCNIHDRCLVGTGGATSCDAPSRQCHRELISCWDSPPAANEGGFYRSNYRRGGRRLFQGILGYCQGRDAVDRVRDGFNRARDAARRAAEAAARAARAAREAARQWRRVRDFFRGPNIPIPRLGF